MLSLLSEAHAAWRRAGGPDDANEDVRLKFRYLDIRRSPIKEGLLLRNRLTRLIRNELLCCRGIRKIHLELARLRHAPPVRYRFVERSCAGRGGRAEPTENARVNARQRAQVGVG